MSLSLALFFVLAALAFLSALGVVIRRNAVHSALLLVLNFACLAVIYVLLQAQFMAVVQVAVYAGAIMVLFLFVIMLLNLGTLDEEVRSRWPVWQSVGVVLAGGLAVMAALVAVAAAGRLGRTGLPRQEASENVQAVGQTLLSSYLYPFEVVSLLLLVAMVGAAVLSRRRPEAG